MIEHRHDKLLSTGVARQSLYGTAQAYLWWETLSPAELIQVCGKALVSADDGMWGMSGYGGSRLTSLRRKVTLLIIKWITCRMVERTDWRWKCVGMKLCHVIIAIIINTVNNPHTYFWLRTEWGYQRWRTCVLLDENLISMILVVHHYREAKTRVLRFLALLVRLSLCIWKCLFIASTMRK